MSDKSADAVVEHLYSAQLKKLVSYLRRRVYDEEDAKDLAQEAFARVLNIERKQAIEEPNHYLLRVAANLAIEHRNRQKRSVVDPVEELPEPEIQEQQNSLEDQASDHRALIILDKELRTLPPNVQAALILHRRDGYTYEEIAERLGVSKSMVKKYLRRGLDHLHAALKDNDD